MHISASMHRSGPPFVKVMWLSGVKLLSGSRANHVSAESVVKVWPSKINVKVIEILPWGVVACITIS